MSALSDRWRQLQPRERAIVAVLGAAVVIAIAFLLLSGGGGGPEPFEDATGRRSPSPAPSPTASPRPVPETFDVFEGKDPFRPLVAVGPGGGGGGPTPGASPTPGGTPGPDGGPSDGQRVSLLDIRSENGAQVATVEVNGQSYNVKEGDRFAGSYRVVDLTSKCGTFVFGDERFTLCIGQEVLK